MAKYTNHGTLHISMLNANQGSVELIDDKLQATVEGHGFGCMPRKLKWTTNLGADGGYFLGISITKTPNAALTAATADKISTNVGESEMEGLTPQRHYFNWCLLNGTTLANGAAGDVITIEGLG